MVVKNCQKMENKFKAVDIGSSELKINTGPLPMIDESKRMGENGKSS